MQFLCEMWKLSAEEYMAFLVRNGIKCFGVHVIYRNKVAIYADEEQYLNLSINSSKFNEDEKQIIKLLERSEALVEKLIDAFTRRGTDQEYSEGWWQQYEEEI